MACQGDQGFASCSEGNVHSLVGMSFPPPLPVCSHLILKYRCLVNLRSPSLSMGLLDFLFFFAGGISALLLLGHLCILWDCRQARHEHKTRRTCTHGSIECIGVKPLLICGNQLCVTSLAMSWERYIRECVTTSERMSSGRG